jgi:hypothetical protein
MYYINPEGHQEEIEEDKLSALWEQRSIAPDALCWKDGMPDWVPASEFFSGSPASGTEAPAIEPQPQAYAYTKDPKSLNKLLVFMLWVSLAMEIVALLGDFSQLSLLSREFTDVEADANDSRQMMIGGIYLLVFIVTGIVFLKWIHRANVNARGFGARGMTHTPGWAVGWFFIPIFSLFRPYQAMKELWKVSQDPTDWQTREGGALLSGWWALWIISNILGQVTMRMNPDTIEKLKTLTTTSIVAEIIGVVLCIVAMAMVKTISRWQGELVGGGALQASRL